MQKITIVSGTNRDEAVSAQIANLYQRILLNLGQECEIVDLTKLPYDFAFTALYDKSGKNADFNHFRELMAESQKFVFIVPEYNGSFPGVLKTFIDGLKFPTTFKGKKCALVGLSSGIQGGGLALSHLTDIFHYCGMEVLSLKPKLSHIEKHFDGKALSNPLYQQLLEEQATKLLNF